MSPSVRRKLVQIHVWLAVVIGFAWALSGLSGALLVFGKEIDRFAGARGTSGAPASLDRVLDNATAAAGGAFIERLLVKDAHADLINALYADRDARMRIVVIDAATAKPLRDLEWEPMTPSGGWYRWLYMFHMTYLTGHNGMALVGISGLALMSAALSGLWIAWPRAGGWRFLFSFERWRTVAQRLYGWHRAVGLTLGLILPASALTGAYMALPGVPIKELVASFAEYQPTHAVKSEHHEAPLGARQKVIGPQRALEVAQRVYPGAAWVRLWPPTERYPFYTVRVRQQGEIRAWLGTTTVVVDAVSGAVTARYDAKSAPAANQIFDAMYSIHNGEIAGPAGRMLAAVAGIALPVLYVTGIWAWWRKRRKKHSATGRAASRIVADPHPIPKRPAQAEPRTADIRGGRQVPSTRQT